MAIDPIITDSTSEYMENLIINFMVRSGCAPSNYLTSYSPYMALFSGSPTDTTIAETEISGSGYMRTELNYRGVWWYANWNVSNGLAVLNSQVDFPVATEAYGVPITHFGIMSGSMKTGPTSASLLFWGPLEIPLGQEMVPYGYYFSIVSGTARVSLQEAYSNWFANLVLNNVLKGISTPNIGLSVYAALYTTMPSDTDSWGVEVTRGYSFRDTTQAYTRKIISGATSWSFPTSGSTSNTSEIVFTTGAPIDWGRIEGMCLRTAQTGGYLLYRGFFNTPITIYEGDGLKFKLNSIQLNMD